MLHTIFACTLLAIGMVALRSLKLRLRSMI